MYYCYKCSFIFEKKELILIKANVLEYSVYYHIDCEQEAENTTISMTGHYRDCRIDYDLWFIFAVDHG